MSHIRCPACGRYTTTTTTGAIRLHPRLDGSTGEKCRGIPITLDDQERAEIAQALQTIVVSTSAAVKTA